MIFVILEARTFEKLFFDFSLEIILIKLSYSSRQLSVEAIKTLIQLSIREIDSRANI